MSTGFVDKISQWILFISPFHFNESGVEFGVKEFEFGVLLLLVLVVANIKIVTVYEVDTDIITYGFIFVPFDMILPRVVVLDMGEDDTGIGAEVDHLDSHRFFFGIVIFIKGKRNSSHENLI